MNLVLPAALVAAFCALLGSAKFEADPQPPRPARRAFARCRITAHRTHAQAVTPARFALETAAHRALAQRPACTCRRAA